MLCGYYTEKIYFYLSCLLILSFSYLSCLSALRTYKFPDRDYLSLLDEKVFWDSELENLGEGLLPNYGLDELAVLIMKKSLI